MIAREGVRSPQSPHFMSTNAAKHIRTMADYHVWKDAVRRAGKCELCGSTSELEAHHIVSLQEIVLTHKITSEQKARRCLILWDKNNGACLCKKCHTALHEGGPQQEMLLRRRTRQ